MIRASSRGGTASAAAAAWQWQQDTTGDSQQHTVMSEAPSLHRSTMNVLLIPHCTTLEVEPPAACSSLLTIM